MMGLIPTYRVPRFLKSIGLARTRGECIHADCEQSVGLSILRAASSTSLSLHSFPPSPLLHSNFASLLSNPAMVKIPSNNSEIVIMDARTNTPFQELSSKPTYECDEDGDWIATVELEAEYGQVRCTLRLDVKEGTDESVRSSISRSTTRTHHPRRSRVPPTRNTSSGICLTQATKMTLRIRYFTQGRRQTCAAVTKVAGRQDHSGSLMLVVRLALPFFATLVDLIEPRFIAGNARGEIEVTVYPGTATPIKSRSALAHSAKDRFVQCDFRGSCINDIIVVFKYRLKDPAGSELFSSLQRVP